MTTDESKMCFITVANRPYQKYIPWFLYFLNRAYPAAYKLVLLDTKINSGIQQILDLLQGNFEIRECAFPEYTRTDALTIKCLRWLIFEPTFNDYDCMSIGDIDVAICRESPSYMRQHLSHCELLKIPYSNCIRANSKPKRMGGIHVVKPKEWFTAIQPMINKYRPMLKTGRIRFPERGFNEQLLLQMIIESSLGAPPTNISNTYWSSLVSSAHHGVHIRLAELGIAGLKKSKGYIDRKSEFLAACRTSMFNELVIRSPQIGSVLNKVVKSYTT